MTQQKLPEEIDCLILIVVEDEKIIQIESRRNIRAEFETYVLVSL